MVDPRAKTDLVDDVRGWGSRRRRRHHRRPQARALRPRHDALREPLRHRAPDHEGSARDDALPRRAQRAPAAPNSNGAFTELVFTGDDSWAETRPRPLLRRGGRRARRERPEGAGLGRRRGHARPLGRRGRRRREAGRPRAKPAPSRPRSRRGSSSIGDSDFASNELLEAYRNRDLFLNTRELAAGRRRGDLDPAEPFARLALPALRRSSS